MGAASSTEVWAMPVRFLQKSLSLGLSVGITNSLNSDSTLNLAEAEIRIAGNSMISGGEESESSLSQQVDSKSTTMRKSKTCFPSALPSRPRLSAYRVVIAPYLRAKAMVFADILTAFAFCDAAPFRVPAKKFYFTASNPSSRKQTTCWLWFLQSPDSRASRPFMKSVYSLALILARRMITKLFLQNRRNFKR